MDFARGYFQNCPDCIFQGCWVSVKTLNIFTFSIPPSSTISNWCTKFGLNSPKAKSSQIQIIINPADHLKQVSKWLEMIVKRVLKVLTINWEYAPGWFKGAEWIIFSLNCTNYTHLPVENCWNLQLVFHKVFGRHFTSWCNHFKRDKPRDWKIIKTAFELLRRFNRSWRSNWSTWYFQIVREFVP